MPQTVNIIDSARNVVATAVVQDLGSHFSGIVDLRQMPDALRRLFEEYEAVVNDQVFSVLDEIEGRISGEYLSVVFGDGSRALAGDIQIFPSTGNISFKPLRMASPAVQ
jgi:hypothetical protein